MLLRIITFFLFVYGDLYLLFDYKEDDTCDCYISLSNNVEIDDNYKVFLSQYKNWLKEEVRDSCRANILIKKVYKEGLLLERVEKKDYDQIRKLAGNITNEKKREIFLNNGNFRKCGFNKFEYAKFFFEIVFYEPKKHTITWEHSASYDYDPKDVFSKLILYRTRSLTINAGFLKKFVKDLNSSICSDTNKSNSITEKKNEEKNLESLDNTKIFDVFQKEKY
ncbi:putative SP-containing protein [Vairimorpha necatrix]|uniref:SP-containing protein n=1 Tax=Vairimorpha necatrix TaxID=6039 RepID=A0AAX4JB41_9MICR